MVELKTAVLLAGAMKIGAIIGGHLMKMLTVFMNLEEIWNFISDHG